MKIDIEQVGQELETPILISCSDDPNWVIIYNGYGLWKHIKHKSCTLRREGAALGCSFCNENMPPSVHDFLIKKFRLVHNSRSRGPEK